MSNTADPEIQVITADGMATPAGKSSIGKGRIAVDMDDVLCQTNATIVQSEFDPSRLLKEGLMSNSQCTMNSSDLILL